MAAPLGVLAAGPATATTGVGDVDGGAPLRPWWYEVSSAKGKDVGSKVTPGGAAQSSRSLH
jgi:hypothetical protein